MQQVMSANMSDAWALLAGRTTYERFASYWPAQAPNPFTDALNSVRKYVASTTLTAPLEWRNSTLITGDVGEAVGRLKLERENLVAFGSGVLVRSLLARGLVDRLVLLIHPLVLGAGLRLFSEAGTELSALHLVDSVTTGTGVIIATYRPSLA